MCYNVLGYICVALLTSDLPTVAISHTWEPQLQTIIYSTYSSTLTHLSCLVTQLLYNITLYYLQAAFAFVYFLLV
jgi:hypothetical protein